MSSDSDSTRLSNIRSNLAQALGISPEELDREFGTYHPPSVDVAGPGCPSDLDWTRLRQTQVVPEEMLLRAHLASCRRCKQRAQNILGPGEGAELLTIQFPHELLCLSEELIILSAYRPDMVPQTARNHLEYCGTCRADRDRLHQ